MLAATSTSTARFAHLLLRVALCIAPALHAERAFAWGDEGHEIVATIAEHFLDPVARHKAFAILAADPSTLTAHDFVAEATWADRYRDSDRNGTKVHYLQTRQWHFVDIEITLADLDAACFQHPAMPTGTAASAGPAADCVVDKIDQFTAELTAPGTSAAERVLALKFILHFVGDIHQPLHASDDHDAGGNAKQVSAAGLGSGSLHAFWDTQFVKSLGTDPATVATMLIAKMTPAQIAQWSGGKTTDWATESFGVSKAQIYAKLPKPQSNGSYLLPPTLVASSEQIVAQQLSKAGVRLATILNRALATP